MYLYCGEKSVVYCLRVWSHISVLHDCWKGKGVTLSSVDTGKKKCCFRFQMEAYSK